MKKKKLAQGWTSTWHGDDDMTIFGVTINEEKQQVKDLEVFLVLSYPHGSVWEKECCSIVYMFISLVLNGLIH